MKKIILLLLFLLGNALIGYTQNLTNLNLSQLCNVPSNFDHFDPFYVGLTQKFCTLPWELSHGTPQIIREGPLNNLTNKIFLGAWRRGTWPNSQDFSEGVFYRYKFKKNVRYRLKFNYSCGTLAQDLLNPPNPNPTDNFSVFFCNNLQTVNEPTEISTSPPNDLNRSYSVPVISDKQTILSKNQIHGVQPTFDQTLYPDKDYDFLWFRSIDLDKLQTITNAMGAPIEPFANASVTLIWGVEVYCDDEPSNAVVNVPTTEVIQQLLLNPNTNINVHKQVQPVVQGKHINVPCIDGPVKIVTTQSVAVPPDVPVLLEASSSIKIFNEFRDPNSKFFEVQPGSIFEARINPFPCIKDNCGLFIPWANSNDRFLWPLRFNRVTDDLGTAWSINAIGFPTPFNSFRFKLRIFNRFGDMIFEKIFGDRESVISTTSLKVLKGELLGKIIPFDVCAFTLELENCEGVKIIAGDITPPLEPNAAMISSTELGNHSINNLADNKPKTTDSYFDVYPNPTTNDCNITFSISDNSKILMTVANQLGQIVKSQNLGEIESGEYQTKISLDDLPNGSYIFTLKTESGKILSKKINKMN